MKKLGPYPAEAIAMTAFQKLILESVTKKGSSSQQSVTRSRLLLLAHEGLNNSVVKRTLGISLNTVKSWRDRWEEAYAGLLHSEAAFNSGELSKSKYRQLVLSVLKNKPRSGAPKRITPAQEQQIVALACDKPQQHGYPLTDWTHKLLAQAAVQKKILPRISSTQVGRILKNKSLTTA